MEIVLATLTAISALSTTALTVLLFQLRTKLNTNSREQVKASTDVSIQIERLLQQNQSLEQKLFELFQQSEKSKEQSTQVLADKLTEQFTTQSQTSEKMCSLLQQNEESQTRNIQMLANKLTEQFTIQSQTSEKMCSLLQQSEESQKRSMNVLAGKLEALKNSLEESVKF
jgi:hypothetical protein